MAKLEAQVGAKKAQERRVGKIGQQVGAKKTRAQIEREEKQRKLREEKIQEQREKAKKELEDFKKKEIRSVSDYQKAYSQLSPVTQRAIKSPSKLKAEQQQTKEKIKSDLERAKETLSRVERKLRDAKSDSQEKYYIRQSENFRGQIKGYKEGLSKLERGQIISEKAIKKYAMAKGSEQQISQLYSQRRAEQRAERRGGEVSEQPIVKIEEIGAETITSEGVSKPTRKEIEYTPTTRRPVSSGNIIKMEYLKTPDITSEDFNKVFSQPKDFEDKGSEIETGTRTDMGKELKGEYNIITGSYVTTTDKGYKKVTPTDQLVVTRGGEPIDKTTYTEETISPSSREFTTTGEEIVRFDLKDEGKASFKGDEFAIDPFARTRREEAISKVEKPEEDFLGIRRTFREQKAGITSDIKSRTGDIEREYGFDVKGGFEEFGSSIKYGKDYSKDLISRRIIPEETVETISRASGNLAYVGTYTDPMFLFDPTKAIKTKEQRKQRKEDVYEFTKGFVPTTVGEVGLDVATYGIGAGVTKGGKAVYKGGRVGYSKLATKFPRLALKETKTGKSFLKTTAGTALGGLYVTGVGKEVIAQPTREEKAKVLGKELRRGVLFGAGALSVERAEARKTFGLLTELQQTKGEASIGFETIGTGKSRLLYRTKKTTPTLKQETTQTFEVLDTGQILKGKGFSKITETKTGLEFIPSKQFTFAGKAYKTKGRRVREVSGDFDTILKSEIKKPLEVYRGEARIVTLEKEPFGTSTRFAGITKKGKKTDRFIIGDITKAYKQRTGFTPIVDIGTGKVTYKPTYEQFPRLRLEPKGVGKVRVLSREETDFLATRFFGRDTFKITRRTTETGKGLFNDIGLGKTPSKRTIQIQKPQETELIQKGGITGFAVEKQTTKLFQPTVKRGKVTPLVLTKTPSKEFKDIQKTTTKTKVTPVQKEDTFLKDITKTRLATTPKTKTKQAQRLRDIEKVRQASELGLKGMLGQKLAQKTIKKPVTKTRVKTKVTTRPPIRAPFRVRPRPTPPPPIEIPKLKRPLRKPIKKKKKRKGIDIYRSPSLVAFGLDIRRKEKGIYEGSGLTIRPIIIPKKKTKKRRKK